MDTSRSDTDKASGSGSASKKKSSFPFKTWKEETVAMKQSGVCKVRDTRTVPEELQGKKHSVLSPSEDEEMQDADQIQDQEMLDEEEETEEQKDAGNKDETQTDEVVMDLPRRRLYLGSFAMDATSLKCLIYKLEKPDQQMWDTFCHLKDFRHVAVDTLHTFYEESGLPRIVLSWLDSMLRDWLRSPLNHEMFFEWKTGGHCLTAWFKTMVIDMCSALEDLFKKELYPVEITMEDLYVCKDGPDRKRIKMLILKVEVIEESDKQLTRMAKLWNDIRDIIGEIQGITKTGVLSILAQRFLKYIGKDANLLKHYPDSSWSLERKGRYLCSIIAADMNSICECLKSSSLQWPAVKKAKDLPKLLSKLIEYDNLRPNPSNYLIERPYDYLRLCQTVYKHFPALVKAVAEMKEFGKPADFIVRMELWEPEIWCILYEAIGVPDKPNILYEGPSGKEAHDSL